MKTPLLERAFAAAAELPEPEQDALASWVMEELEAQSRWDTAFASSQDVLAQMAEQALAEHQAGETQPLDLDAR